VGFFKYWWDIELDKLKQKSIEAHKLWLAASRPMSGDIYNSKRVSKAQKHSTVTVCDAINNKVTVQSLMSYMICFSRKTKLIFGKVGVVSLSVVSPGVQMPVGLLTILISLMHLSTTLPQCAHITHLVSM